MKALLLYLLFLAGSDTPPIPPDTPDAAEYPLPATIREALDENVFIAEIAAQTLPDYTADNNGEIVYFSPTGEYSAAPVEGGYSRKVLGKTADGRAVIQDYYLESGAAQTGITELVKGADIRDFSTDVLQGRSVWYLENGAIYSHADFKEGVPTGPGHYYLDGQLAVQIDSDAGIPHENPYNDGKLIVQFFHDNGMPLMRRYLLDTRRLDIFYREDGSPLVISDADSDEYLQFWHPDGRAAEMGDIVAEYIPITRRYGEILIALAAGYAEVFRGTDGQTPFGEAP